MKQDGDTYIIDDKGLSDDEVMLALMAKQTYYLGIIKTIIIFSLALSLFTVILSLITVFAL